LKFSLFEMMKWVPSGRPRGSPPLLTPVIGAKWSTSNRLPPTHLPVSHAEPLGAACVGMSNPTVSLRCQKFSGNVGVHLSFPVFWRPRSETEDPKRAKDVTVGFPPTCWFSIVDDLFAVESVLNHDQRSTPLGRTTH